MERTLCTNCNRIYTPNKLCVHCIKVDPEKVYPSKISVVYPEGSLHQKLATYAFNHLAHELEDNEELLESISTEFEATEDDILAALEDLYTEN